MVLWQPVVHFRTEEEENDSPCSYYCREVFQTPDEAKSHGYDVADKMGQNMNRFVQAKRIIFDE